jgi:dTDP-glucose 4,6-dehydratase
MHLKNFGNVINLGTGSSISVKNLCKLILEIINVDKKIVQIKNRKRPINSEVENLLSDNSRAKKMLRWKPKYQSYQGLRNSLIETIEWYKANKDLYNHKNKNYVI